MTDPVSVHDLGVKGFHSELRVKRRKRFRKMPRLLSQHQLVEYWVFQEVSLDLRPGDALFVYSEDALTVTTFFRAVCNLLQPDAGTVTNRNRSLLLNPLKRRAIRNLSVGQAIRMLCGLYGMTDDETDERFDRIARQAGVKRELGTLVDDIPRRVQDQISFSVGLAAPVGLLALDRVARVGERPYANKCMDRLVEARQAGQILLFTGKDPNQIEPLATGALELREEGSTRVPIEQAREAVMTARRSRVRRRKPQHDESDDPDQGFL
ncbi:MAG: hypothetical protein KDC39_05435 [Actinobacteria bacterium]|nr:hypothetical protein [Actinomycetota bacterium]